MYGITRCFHLRTELLHRLSAAPCGGEGDLRVVQQSGSHLVRRGFRRSLRLLRGRLGAFSGFTRGYLGRSGLLLRSERRVSGRLCVGFGCQGVLFRGCRSIFGRFGVGLGRLCGRRGDGGLFLTVLCCLGRRARVCCKGFRLIPRIQRR